MRELTVEQKKELMIPTLYWVSHLVLALREIARDEWWEKKDETTRYAHEIERYYGLEALELMREPFGMTGVELMDRADAWYIMPDLVEGEVTTELEDVIFHAGEIRRGIETVMMLAVQLGIEDTETFTNECCADFIGTTTK